MIEFQCIISIIRGEEEKFFYYYGMLKRKRRRITRIALYAAAFNGRENIFSSLLRLRKNVFLEKGVEEDIIIDVLNIFAGAIFSKQIVIQNKLLSHPHIPPFIVIKSLKVIIINNDDDAFLRFLQDDKMSRENFSEEIIEDLFELMMKLNRVNMLEFFANSIPISRQMVENGIKVAREKRCLDMEIFLIRYLDNMESLA